MLTKPRPRTIRLPLRLLDRRYGAGTHDVAGDDIAYWATTFAGQRPIQRMSFDYETTHTNPWYHELVVAIDSIDDDVNDALVNRLIMEGLLEPPHSWPGTAGDRPSLPRNVAIQMLCCKNGQRHHRAHKKGTRRQMIPVSVCLAAALYDCAARSVLPC